METLDHIFQNFNEYLIVLLLVVLFFKESVMSFVSTKFGFKEKPPKWGEDATKEINRLAEYANHDTTDRLNTLIAMEEKEHEAAQETRDHLMSISRTLSEIKEYGLPCRNK